MAKKKLTPIEAKLQELAKARKAKRELEALNALNNPLVANTAFVAVDMAKLKPMVDTIEQATGKPVYRGYIYDEVSETLIAIATSLMYAKREARELIPTTYYSLFSSAVSELIEVSYGRLPFFKEPTVITLEDGSVQVLDTDDLIAERLQGKQADVVTLKAVIATLADSLELDSVSNISQELFDKAFTRAKAEASMAYANYQLKQKLMA